MKRFFLLLCALLSLVNVVAQVTTASLRGVVVNSSNEVLVGATVVLSHPQTGREYIVVSDATGRYALHGVRPGSGYSLAVSYVGFESQQLEELLLKVGETREIDIVLKESVEIQQIVVKGSGVDAGEMKNQFSEKLISQMPTLSRSLYDVVRLVPQAISTKGGGISYGGVSNRYNSFMVNGVANNDM